ncbi:hypothetical protein MJH12_15230 [bacterium]|nr:hypothetical protein [bacterium]
MATKFPVDQLLHDDFLHESFPKLIISSTGSGKSTRLPQFLLKKKRKFILVEPRRIVVKSLHHYLTKELSIDCLGFQIRFEKKVVDTDIGLIVTPGILISYFLYGFPKGFEDCIYLLDEFHERQKEIDFILAILKRRKVSKLILLSATLDAEDLKGYLEFSAFKIDERRYQVERVYQKGLGFPTHLQLDQRVLNALKSQTYRNALVFLPGKKEIFSMHQYLCNKVSKKVYPIYGGQDFSEQDRFLRCKEDKILLSTNILESSITVDGIDLVVDSGLSKSIQYRYGREVLSLEAISEQSANQRMGRTGRTADGVCIRLWAESYKLDEKQTPEILRSDLSDLLLKANRIAYDASSLSYLDEPKSYQWKDAQDKLKSLGLLEGRSQFEIPINFSVETFKVVHELQKQKEIEYLSYYLFQYSLSELNLKSSFYEKLEKKKLKIPIDLHIYNLKSEELRELLKGDYFTFQNLLKQYKKDFSCDFKLKMTLESRQTLMMLLCSAHKEGLFFHVKKSIFRNAYGVELHLNDEIDTEKYPMAYVLDFFELEDEKRKRRIYGGSYLVIPSNQIDSLPSTSTTIHRVFVRKDIAYQELQHFCGSYKLGFETKLLQGQELLDFYSDQNKLDSVISQIEDYCFYFSLYQEDLVISSFLKKKLFTFGVENYEDLLMVEAQDFFESDFLLELPSLQKKFPRISTEPGGKYHMEYNLKKRQVYFCLLNGKKAPSKLLLKKFSGLRCFWKYKGRILSL